jgi:hypothetical protein
MSTELSQLKYEPSTQIGINRTQDCVIFNFRNRLLGNWIKNFTFYSCYVDQLSPHIGIAMVIVLERLGYAIHYPKGQPATFSRIFSQNS